MTSPPNGRLDLIAHVGRPATRRDELKSNIIRLADHIPGLCAPAAIAQTAALPSPAINSRRRIRQPFFGSVLWSGCMGTD